jgi:tocopherol O-methyltransferase
MSQNEHVIAYYQAAGSDYRRFWFSRQSLAMHYGYYDETVRSHDASLLKLNDVLARKAEITAADRVLDAGCGYGGSAFWLARVLGCQVVGITIVPQQVEQAQRAAAAQQMADRVRFEVMDYTQTTFPDASFDVVWAIESVLHTDRKAAFVQEASRLLRPGGRLMLCEHMLREDPPLSPAERALLAPWLEGWAMAGLLAPGQYSALLAANGFGLVHMDDLTNNVRRSLDHLGKLRLPALPATYPLLALARLLQAVHLYHPLRVKGYRGGLHQNLGLRRGLWRYMALVAEKAAA